MKFCLLISLVAISFTISLADSQPGKSQLTFLQPLFPYTFQWQMLPNTPVACKECAGAMITDSEFGQICGRKADGSIYPYIQFYRTSWEEGTVEHPGEGVWGHSAAVAGYFPNLHIIVSGGISPSGYYNFCSDYQPSSMTWTQSTLMPHPNMIYTAMCGGLSANTLYMVGGQLGQAGPVVSDFYTFQLTATDMNPLPNMPVPRCAATAVFCYCSGGYRIYVLGGSADGVNAANTIYRYSINDSTWELMSTRLLTPRMGASAAFVEGSIYIFGGKNGGAYLNSVERYDIGNNTIEDSPAMLYSAAYMASACTVSIPVRQEGYDGYVYLSGGVNQSGVLNSASQAHIYEPWGKVEPTSLGNLRALYH